MKNVGVLFVCMGNICRSPMAEGVFRQRVKEAGLEERIRVDSAGTHAYHVGEAPDHRAQAAARERGIDISAQRARQVTAEDLQEFQYVLAMDRDNHAGLARLAGNYNGSGLHMFLDFSRASHEREVPDPYYGGPGGFERVLDLVEDAADGLLEQVRREHLKDL